MSGTIEIRELGTSEHESWERFVADAPGGSVYALPGYLEVLCDATDAAFRVVVAERGGRTLGGVALFERQSPVGIFVAPRLLLYYNGPVFAAPCSKYPSERTSLQIKLVDALEGWLAERDYAHVCFKSRSDLTDARPFMAHGWTTALAYSYEVRLTDPQTAWERVEGNFRRLVRRCDRDGLQLVADDDFDAFYANHLAVHDRKSSPVYLPRPRFRRYFERLRERDLCRLYHARLPDGTAAASQLVLLGPHPVTHTVCAGATAEHLTSGASVFLRWKVLEALATEGYAGNDLTDAELNKVTHFKSQFGGDLKLSLVLHRPGSAAWRLREQALGAASFTRRAVRYAARRLGSGSR